MSKKAKQTYTIQDRALAIVTWEYHVEATSEEEAMELYEQGHHCDGECVDVSPVEAARVLPLKGDLS